MDRRGGASSALTARFRLLKPNAYHSKYSHSMPVPPTEAIDRATGLKRWLWDSFACRIRFLCRRFFPKIASPSEKECLPKCPVCGRLYGETFEV